MIVAVATQVEGFTTVSQLVPALAFHAVTSVAGVQLLLVAAKQKDAEVALHAETAGSRTTPPAIPVKG